MQQDQDQENQHSALSTFVKKMTVYQKLEHPH